MRTATRYLLLCHYNLWAIVLTSIQDGITVVNNINQHENPLWGVRVGLYRNGMAGLRNGIQTALDLPVEGAPLSVTFPVSEEKRKNNRTDRKGMF